MDAVTQTAERRMTMAEYIEREATNKYYVVRDKNTGLYFRGKGVNKWGKYYNQASIYRIKAHAENTVEGETRRGAQPEVVEIRIVEPSTGVVEVIQGEWVAIEYNDGSCFNECSNCGARKQQRYRNFCSNCGAVMQNSGRNYEK